MHQVRRTLRPALALALLTGLLAAAPGASAQVSILSTYQVQGALYHYEFRVLNLTPDTLAIVTLNGVPDLLDVQNLLAPTGFDAAYDPGLALMSFLEDADPGTEPTFAPGTLQGIFTFDSAQRIDTFQFEALDTGGNAHIGSFGPTAAPEPGALSLTLSALGVAAVARRRRKGNP